MALYQLKPASRSFFIDQIGASMLPYVWIGTAVTMVVVITFYNRLVERYHRLHVVLGSCIVFVALLVLFRLSLLAPTPLASFAFYIFVDIFGVVMVEQFWCLTNSIYTTDEGKSWYGFVGTGGLAGGVLGGVFAAFLIKQTPLQTPDLLLSAAVIVGLIFLLTWLMGASGIYCEADNPASREHFASGLKAVVHSRYLVLIAGLLLLAQVASQFVEYQFLNVVELSHPEREARTAYLSLFFGVLSGVAIATNLGLTPLIHRRLGVMAGLLMQPLMMALCSFVFMFQTTLLWGSITKISDRGLNYSINRASKELLYVPVNPVVIYQAKAWIDMFGYRMFKVFGSFVILLFTQWLPWSLSVAQLSWFTLATCALWIALIFVLDSDYRLFSKVEH